MLLRLLRTPGQVAKGGAQPGRLTLRAQTGPSGHESSAITGNARIACLSSFCRFPIRKEMVSAKPCSRLDWPRIRPSPGSGLSAAQGQQLLAAISDAAVGLRNWAIVLTLLLTGRRRSGVMNLTAG